MNPWEKIKDYYELLNPLHALIVLIAIITGIKTAGGTALTINLLYSALMSFSIIAGAFILNDYWDFEADKTNNRQDKPLVKGTVSKKTALTMTIVFLIIGNYFSWLVNEKVFFITLVFTGVLLAYNYWLKKIALIGNLTIGLAMAIPFVYGNYMASMKLSLFVLLLSLMAFLMGVGREMIASIRDKKGDLKQGRKTLPAIIGDSKTSYLASLLILISIFTSFIPFLMQGIFYHNLVYLMFILITDVLLAVSIIDALQLRKFKLVRKMTLIAQLTGVLGFLLATLF